MFNVLDKLEEEIGTKNLQRYNLWLEVRTGNSD